MGARLALCVHSGTSGHGAVPEPVVAPGCCLRRASNQINGTLPVDWAWPDWAQDGYLGLIDFSGNDLSGWWGRFSCNACILLPL